MILTSEQIKQWEVASEELIWKNLPCYECGANSLSIDSDDLEGARVNCSSCGVGDYAAVVVEHLFLDLLSTIRSDPGITVSYSLAARVMTGVLFGLTDLMDHTSNRRKEATFIRRSLISFLDALGIHTEDNYV